MKFGNPVRGTIYLSQGNDRWYRSQRFGCTGYPAERPFGKCDHFHRGIDIAKSDGSCGSDVLAVHSGTVHMAGQLPGGAPSYGAIVVEINHGDGWFSVVTHLQRETVTVGQHVSQGQKIGEHGRTGNATGCHVHLGIKSDCKPPYGSILGDSEGTWRDPWPLLEQNITVHPAVDPSGINIRVSPRTDGAAFARTTSADHIERLSDGADLGRTATWRNWNGTVSGGSYTVGPVTDDHWETIVLPGADGKSHELYVASRLAVLSAR